jgi:hypothetical protein
MISTNPGLENYIGKRITEYPNAIFENENKQLGAKTYGIQERLFFFEKSYTYLNLETDDDYTITSLSFLINKINTEIFEKMVLKYGVPDEMFKMDKIIKTEYSEELDYVGESKYGIAKACAFIDEPIFIIWHKQGYKITISQHTDNWYSHIKYEKSLP